MGKKVPEVLFTGHHANIEKWRREQSIIRTLAARPDLLEDANLSDQERRFLKTLQEDAVKENTAAENNHTDHKK
jgi:tRNA (guanine37-N1)-methyltransferase